jgi:hypothetical protein
MAVLALFASTGALFGCGGHSQSASAIVADAAPPGLVASGTLPPGHPPVPGHEHSPALPEGHPPIPGFGSAPVLPEGHPRCPARGVMGNSPVQDPAISQPRIIST